MFNLTDYEKDIRTGATTAKVAPEEAMNQFIYNLVIMRDHYKIFSPEIDFRALGQQWNRLSSDTRNTQKISCCNALRRSSHGL